MGVSLIHFAHRQQFEDAIASKAIPFETLSPMSPVSDDVQIFCQRLNYSDHRLEGSMSEGSQEEENLIFNKASSSICGPNDSILRPAG